MNVTDGPFTEAKEVVGGFAMLKADSRKRRLNWRRIPEGVGEGECELRQLYDANAGQDQPACHEAPEVALKA